MDRVREWAKAHGIDYFVYRVWTSMRERCNNPSCHAFSRYGGRGIKVCQRWNSFACFAADMGPRPAGLTIERKKNHKGYSPANCLWATRKTQQRNTRKTKLTLEKVKNIRVRYATGVILQRELAKEYGVHQVTISEAIRGARWG